MKISVWLAVLCTLIFDISSLSAAETIKIATILSKTGQAAQSNISTQVGIRLAVEELNQQGGVLGKTIELIELDNQSTAIGSKIAAQKAVREGVVCVLGANWSSHSLAMAPVLQEARIPMISPYSTNPQVTEVGDYIFRICFIDSFQGRVMANFAFQDLKAKTAGVLIHADSKYSEGLAQFFVEYFQKQGGKILFEENYLEQAADYSHLVDKIMLFQPDIVFLPGYPKDSSYIIKQARNKGLQLTFLGGDGWADTMFDIVGNTIEGSLYSSHWHPDSSGAQSRQFIKKHGKRISGDAAGHALGYDCAMLFGDAVRRAGSLDPVEIRKSIAMTQNYEGVTGNISFDEHGNPIKWVLRFLIYIWKIL